MASYGRSIIIEDLEKIVSAPLTWEQIFRKTVLITGANGFVPAYMLETLLHLNQCCGAEIRVTAVVRNPEKARARLGVLLDDPAVTLVVQDIRQPFRGPRHADFIIHAASQASPKFYGRDPVGTFETNVLGTRNMLDLATEARSEAFLFFSSGEVYGRSSHPSVPVSETDFGHLDPMIVRSCYAEGKRAGETLCACWHAQHGVPAKVIRLSHTYGPGMALDDGRVFADFVADIVARRDIVMKSDGSAKRPFCYLADATIAFFTVLLRGNAGEAYNVGSETEVSVLELAEMLCNIFPDRNCRVIRQERSRLDTYVASTVSGGHFDLSRIRALGWEPTTGIEEGFRRTVQSYEDADV